MDIRKLAAALLVIFATCAPDQVKPLALTILKPADGDTLHTDTIPIEGITTVGATVHVAGSSTDTGFLFPVNDSGHFAGGLPFENQTGTYVAIFRVKMGTLTIEDSRTVYYVAPQP